MQVVANDLHQELLLLAIHGYGIGSGKIKEMVVECCSVGILYENTVNRFCSARWARSIEMASTVKLGS